ncbi:MAG: Ldh family oxidoreductase, partial [Microbacterium sp.]
MTIDGNRLLEWTTRVLESWGYRQADAAYLADTLVDANLRGVDSHGVIRLPAYRAQIDAGLVRPRATPTASRSGATVRIDADGAPGQLAARAAVDEVDALSSDVGIATAVIHGSTHFGTAGFYARELARRGKVAMVVSNSEPIVVPFGGREPLLGTNPFAFAAPTSGEPISLDMATSTSAMGKVLVARAKGTEIPADWGVDASGAPTTDPDSVTALLPAGGPKGYGLGFLVEILGGVLSGAAIAGQIGNMYSDLDRPQNVGHWML